MEERGKIFYFTSISPTSFSPSFAMIPEGFITTLLDRADIVDVVGRYVTLKKGGRNFMACCPFHKEKTPSFSVSPSKQIFKCFGCGKSGNAVGFLMEMERLSFPDAVRRLAEIYGMEVPEDRSPARREAVAKAKSLSDYMKEAADFYSASLKETKKAIDYLKNREITGETAARFGLGYSPDGWHGLMAVFPGEKYRAKELIETGLVLEKNGRRYDAFRDRIMFPIRSPKGTVLGFGARTMKGDEQPKYLNSPETPIYHKGSELYGLFEGRAAIIERGRAIVCEGYMDVIQLSQAGFRETVAALGTSITPEHVKKLFKLTDSVYFSFDGDAAGRKAARRALESSLSVIVDGQAAHFVLLPPEHDPDSLIKAEGSEGYEHQIKKALPLTEFLKSLVCEGRDLVYAEERAKLAADAKPLILAMKNAPVLRLSLIKDIATLVRLPQEDLMAQWGIASSARPVATSGELGDGWRQSGGFRGTPNGERFFGGAWRSYGNSTGFNRFNRWQRRPMPEPRIGVQDVRDRMLQCFLAYPGLLTEFSEQIEEEFVDSPNPAAARIVEVWRAALRTSEGVVAHEEGSEEDEQSAVLSPAALLMRLADSPEATRYETLLSEELTLETQEEAARLEIRRDFLTLELERLKSRLLTLSSSGADIAQLRALVRRRGEVEHLIAEAAEAERAYRRRLEIDARKSAFAAAEAGKSDVVYSDNEKVRRLQMELFGNALVQPKKERKVEPAMLSTNTRTTPVTSASPFGRPPMASVGSSSTSASPWEKVSSAGSVQLSSPVAPSSGAAFTSAPTSSAVSPFGAAPRVQQAAQTEQTVTLQPSQQTPQLSAPSRTPEQIARRSRRDEILAAITARAEARAGKRIDDPNFPTSSAMGDSNLPEDDAFAPPEVDNMLHDALSVPLPELPSGMETGLDDAEFQGLVDEAYSDADDHADLDEEVPF